MNTTAIIHTAIATYQTEIEQLRAWVPSKRRTALIAMREELIERMMSVIECDADAACESAEGEMECVELGAELEEAILVAQAVGCAVVNGAGAMMQEMERVLPGCVTRHGDLWIATARTDEGEMRLVRRANSRQGAMSWRAA